MMHLDDESVDMIALGDRALTNGESEHLAVCPSCADELEAMLGVVAIGRSSRAEELVPPSSHVWTAIHSELNLSTALAADPLSTRQDPARGVHDATEVSQASTDYEVRSDARVTPIGRARGATGFGRWWPLAAAAMVIGVVTGIIGTQLWPAATEKVLAEATLEPFPTWTASGTAQLADVDGVRELFVDLDAGSGGLREVWLIDPETSGLLSLGLLDGATGQFRIPAAVDLTRYSVVDISEEPNDGNPGHSGDSIVRGQLRNA